MHDLDALVLHRCNVRADGAIRQRADAQKTRQIAFREIDHLEAFFGDRDRARGKIDLLIGHARQQARKVLRAKVCREPEFRSDSAHQLDVEARHLAVVDVRVRLVVRVDAGDDLARRQCADVIGGVGGGRHADQERCGHGEDGVRDEAIAW